MPWVKCPNCGQLTHLNAEISAVNVIRSGVCLFCYRRARRGSNVRIWRIPKSIAEGFPGTVGTVATVLAVDGDPAGQTPEVNDVESEEPVPATALEVETTNGYRFTIPRNCVYVL